VFNPLSNTIADPTEKANSRTFHNRTIALEKAVALATAGAARYGAKGYTSHTLLTYTAEIAKFLDDGTVPSNPEAAGQVVTKPKETDPAHAPGPETRAYLTDDPLATKPPLATPGEPLDLPDLFVEAKDRVKNIRPAVDTGVSDDQL
jgi:hypothetical protein